MPKPKLIVNADDYGLNPNMTQGILDVHAFGLVTQTSVMTAVPEEHLNQALQTLKETPTLEAGLHVVLCQTNGPRDEKLKPLTDNVDFLCQANGQFKRLTPNFVRAKLGLLNKYRSELKGEIAAQLNRLRDMGLTVNHINTHCYMGITRLITNLLIEVAKENNIGFIRNPVEVTPHTASRPGKRSARLMRFLQRGRPGVIAKSKLATSSCYRGTGSIGFTKAGEYIPYLQTVPEAGLCEWTLHVEKDRDAGDISYEHSEYQALMDPELKAFVLEHFDLTTSSKVTHP